MKETIGNMVDVGDFVVINDDSFAEHGLPEGSIIYLAGDAIVNVDEGDPYALRRIFLGAFLEDNHIMLDKGAFTIDGTRLSKVDEKTQKELDFIKNEDFDLEEPNENESTH